PSCGAINTGINIQLIGGATAYLANTTTTTRILNFFVCPSDTPLDALNDGPSFGTGTPYAGWKAARSNYLLPGSRYHEPHNPRYMNVAFSGRPDDEAVFSGTDWSTKIASVRDGAANTTLVIESKQEKMNKQFGGYWGQGVWTSTHMLVYNPNDPIYGPDSEWTKPNAKATAAQSGNPSQKHGYAWTASSGHPGGVHAAFVDGSVKFILNSINPSVWFAIQTIRSKELLGSDDF
ncbi:MAG: DUF1559 domain-containing protein, partial [Isosphaeraceae bacterium]